MLSVESKPGIHGDTLTDWVRQYHQGVLAIDEGVGRLIKALEGDRPIRQHADRVHVRSGLRLGAARLPPQAGAVRRHDPLAADRLHAEPVAGGGRLRIAGGRASTWCRRSSSFAGLDLPWKMHGHDLTPLLKDPKAEWPHPVLTTLLARSYGSDTDHVPTDPEVRDLDTGPLVDLAHQGPVQVHPHADRRRDRRAVRPADRSGRVDQLGAQEGIRRQAGRVPPGHARRTPPHQGRPCRQPAGGGDEAGVSPKQRGTRGTENSFKMNSLCLFLILACRSLFVDLRESLSRRDRRCGANLAVPTRRECGSCSLGSMSSKTGRPGVTDDRWLAGPNFSVDFSVSSGFRKNAAIEVSPKCTPSAFEPASAGTCLPPASQHFAMLTQVLFSSPVRGESV